MKNVIWNTNIKTLNKIIKTLKSAVDVGGSNMREELECIRMILKKGSPSIFISCDGHRIHQYKCYVDVSKDLDTAIKLQDLLCLQKEMKGKTDISIEFDDAHATACADGRVITMKMFHPSLELLEKIPTYTNENLFLKVKDLLEIGGNSRSHIGKAVHILAKMINQNYEILWEIGPNEHSYKTVGRSKGKVITESVLDKELGCYDTKEWTQICINYKYFMDALKTLPKNEYVRLCIGYKMDTPVSIISADLDYSFTIMPIITNHNVLSEDVA